MAPGPERSGNGPAGASWTMPAGETFGPPVHVYTVADGLADGLFVDVLSPPGRALADVLAGRDVVRQHIPRAVPGSVVLSIGAWHDVAAALAARRWMNDWPGVLHDLLWMGRGAAAASYRAGGAGRPFRWILRGAPGRNPREWMAAVSGGVLTFYRPEDD